MSTNFTYFIYLFSKWTATLVFSFFFLIKKNLILGEGDRSSKAEQENRKATPMKIWDLVFYNWIESIGSREERACGWKHLPYRFQAYTSVVIYDSV